jgi:hypothetical protein
MIFTDPMAQVIIADGHTGKVWVLTDPNTPWVQSVTLSWQGNMVIEGISIGVDIPYEYAMQLLDRNNSPFKQGNVLKTRIGYAAGGWTDWVYGSLNSGGYGLTVSPDGISGTLKVTSVATKIGGYTLSKEILQKATHKADILIKMIAELIGIGFKITPNAQERFDTWKLVGQDEKSYKTRYDYIGSLAGRETYAAIDDLCLRTNCNYKILIENSKRVLHVYTTEDAFSGNLMIDRGNMAKYVVRGILDTSINQYPCFSFTSDSDTDDSSWTTPSSPSSGFEAVGIDSGTGDDVRFNWKFEDSEVPQVGVVDTKIPEEIKPKLKDFEDIFVDAEKKDGRRGTFMSAPVLPGGHALFTNQAVKFGMSGNPGLKMEINTIGVPWERVGNICQVWGAGELYDDEYQVDKVVHSWTPGVWDMTLGVFRYGKKDVAGNKPNPKGGQVPKQ